MRVFGKPQFLNLYRLYFQPLLTGIDTDRWDLDLYLLTPAEMPTGGPNSTRPHFQPPRTVRIPIVEFDSVYTDIVFMSNIPLIAHEIGHFIHEEYMGADGSGKWYEFAAMTGAVLDFDWQTKQLNTPYPHVPAYETFADHFRDWLQGRRPGQKHSEFYFSLWGQETPKGEIAEEMKKIEMWVGSKIYRVDGQERVMDTAPVIIGNRTMVPVRFIAEALGKKVGWDEKERKVTIE